MTIKFPSERVTCTYQYDLMDRATNIVYKTANGSLIRGLEYEYNAASMIVQKRILNNEQGTPNFEVNYTYDSLDRLVHESSFTNGNSLFDIHYSYDFAGNRTFVQSTIGNQQSEITYPLGMGNRLASTNMLYISGTANEPIGLDNRWGTLSVSNLTSGASTVPLVNGNSFFAELPALAGQTNTVKAAIRDCAGNTSYPTKDYWIETTSSTNIINHHAYNDAGCLTNINGVSLEWDERYRLISVDGASSSVQYTYDVLNQRASRTSLAGGITNVEFYVYNGKQIIADLDGSGNLLRTYVWGTGIDNLLSMTTYTNGGSQASATYYAIKDHQNTVIAFVDSSGSVVESYEYSAYGEILDVKDSSGNSIANQKSAIGNRYAFQGREIDWTTGLIYFRARWYNPSTGRFISKDPIGISGGLNLYAFVGNNPVNFTDPSGLKLKFCGSDDHKKRVKAALLKIAKSDPRYWELIRSLVTSNHTFTFSDVETFYNNVVVPDYPGNASMRGVGSSATIYTDPATSNGPYSGTSVLAHELQHAYQVDKGVLSRSYNERENSARRAGNAYRSTVGETPLRPMLP